MSSLNQCQFIGNLGRDPEVRHTQAGAKIVHLNLAVSERWKSREGTQHERTTWVPVVIFNEKLGEIAERYLKKGDKCFVSGQFQTRKWTDQQGQERYSTEIVMSQFNGQLVLLGGRSGGTSPDAAQAGPSHGLDDDIPF